MNTIAVFTTIDDAAQARAIAHDLVEQKLAACVQISAIDSVYDWQGETQEGQEFRLVLKTTRERYKDVETAIRRLHSYDLPAVYALEAVEAFEPYARWVDDNSRGR